MILPCPLLLIISSTLFIVSSKKKSLKIVFYSIIGVAILGIFALSFFTWIKSNKNLKLENKDLISITIKTTEQEVTILKEDFDSFIVEINLLKYKKIETDVKTKGDYFIIFKYYKGEIELGKYRSLFYGQYGPTLFKDDFDGLAQKWMDKYKK
ncbi:MAG: hypothetical protein GX312_01860 [Candidatus Phytoplasma sp.]|nr:hypothetical protein [Phytoplasma sp.]